MIKCRSDIWSMCTNSFATKPMHFTRTLTQIEWTSGPLILRLRETPMPRQWVIDLKSQHTSSNGIG